MFRNLLSDKKKRIALVSFILFFVALTMKFLYFKTLKGILIYPDSTEYIATSNIIKDFKVDASRVPVYPFFILMMRNILRFGGFTQEVAVVVSQAVIASAALVVLYYICKMIFGSSLKSLIIFAFCLASISLTNWDFLILTESLAITFITLLLLCFVIYIRTDKKLFLILLFTMSLLLIYLKPFYLFIPILIALISIIRNIAMHGKPGKDIVLISVISLLVIYASVFAYSYVNFKQNGYRGISNVSIINRFGKVLQYGMYEYGENEKLNNEIKKEIEANNGMLPVPIVFICEHGLNSGNYSEISDYVSGIIKKHPLIYIQKTLEFIFNDLYRERYFIDYNHVYAMNNYKSDWPIKLYNTLNDIKVVNSFAFVFAVIFIEIGLLVVTGVKKKFLDWTWIFITLVVLYQLGMSILGSHGEYHRLMAPVYILTILIIFNLLFRMADLFLDKGFLKDRLKV